jgi:hypothetical protein
LVLANDRGPSGLPLLADLVTNSLELPLRPFPLDASVRAVATLLARTGGETSSLES